MSDKQESTGGSDERLGGMMKFRLYMCALILLTGCSPSMGRDVAESPDNADKQPFQKPTAENMRRVLGAGYKLPPGLMQECIGRLIFDVAETFQWPTHVNADGHIFGSLFSDRVFDVGDEITVGDVRIAVIGPATGPALKRAKLDTPHAKIAQYREYIKGSRDYIERIRSEKNISAQSRREIEEEETKINGGENTIREIQETYEDVAFPFPDSEAFWKREMSSHDEAQSDSVYRADLIRGDFIYIFESTVRLSESMTKERHKQQFIDVVGSFRPRKPHEIPTELGVCIPHGFLADDGKRMTDIKQSIRWQDAPGVIYSIQTGNSTPNNTKAAYLTAIATAMAAGKVSGKEHGEKVVLTHQIGPRLTKIGGLPASQGGFALRVDKSGKESFHGYNVFTGYSGWWGTAVLPFILIEMSTRSIEQAPELKQNPPPFEKSMGRLDTLLKSMRLRPTNPLMPDFAALNAQKR